MHEIQMPGNDRSVLWQMIGYGSDIGSAVLHQELQYLQPNRLTQGFEKPRVEVLDQLIQNIYGGRFSIHD